MLQHHYIFSLLIKVSGWCRHGPLSSMILCSLVLIDFHVYLLNPEIKYVGILEHHNSTSARLLVINSHSRQLIVFRHSREPKAHSIILVFWLTHRAA